jgi:DNA polymerase III subunit epsilon
VTGIECATPLEAEIRELRLIAEHKPKYNRRSRFPERVHWIKLTREPWPRLSIVRVVSDDGADYIGPYSSKRTAERSVAALHEAFPIRQCGGRMPKVPAMSACALAEMGKCLSPCNGGVSPGHYAAVVEELRASLHASPEPVVSKISKRMAALATASRFEDAGSWRDRLASFLRGAARTQRLRALTRCPEVVAARRDEGRWTVHVIRHGRLTAAGVIPPGAHAGEWVRQLRESAETVVPGPGPTPATTAEETEKILRWLESDGVRLVHVEGEWTCPVGGATKHLDLHDAVEQSRNALVPFDDRRSVRTVHQPVR